MMRTFNYGFLAIVAMMVAGVPSARAQEQNQGQGQGQGQSQTQPQGPEKATQPIPAYHSPLASAADNGEDDANGDPQKLVPDTRSLTGVQDLSLGQPATSRSYWQPHLDVTTTADSNPLTGTNQTGWSSFTSIYGGIDLHRTSGNSALLLSYIGGGSFSNDGNASDGVIQGMNVSEKLTYRRFAVSLIDQFLYGPQTAVGSGQIPGSTVGAGGGNIGLGGGYTPGQSVLTERGQRITNSSDVEVDAYLTARSSLTFVGGYSLLDGLDDSLLNYGNVIASAGYNYQMSPDNTIGVSYQFSGFNYSNFNQSIKNNIVSVSYGRRITGRLAFQASGGPDIAFVRMPITAGGTGTPTSGSQTQVYGSFNTSLQYKVGRTSMSAAYSRGISGGSGVLPGAINDNVTGSVNRQLTRTFSGGWNGGYSRNHGLSTNETTFVNQTFNYWFTGLNLNHPWGRTMNLYVNYQLQYQEANTSICTVPTPACGASVTRNTITVGLGWHKQPTPF
jgi:hypothetical protein